MARIYTGSIYATVPLTQAPFQTRILSLEPVLSDSQDDGISPVICTLAAYTLDSAPDYEALSYCWGFEPADSPVLVNGEKVLVTANLASALSHLRRSNSHRLLWIDALCINQRDTQERSAQVAQMHTIYQNAQRTIAWIGHSGDEDGESAVEFLRWYAGRKLMMHPTDVDGRHGSYEKSGWAAVSKLMQRPYWRRLWVMQELALSRGLPSVVCGRQYISWRLLIAALDWSVLGGTCLTRLNRVRGAVRKLTEAQAAEAVSKSSTNNLRDGSLSIFLLSHSAAFQTSEPRDRVYALYGLLRAVGIVDFTPDYSMDIADVYKQITAFVLRCKGGLDVLELKPRNQDPALPSWVVDLSKPPSPQLPVTVPCPWQRHSSPDVEQVAAGLEKLALEPKDSIAVTGVPVDEVTSVLMISSCVARALANAAKEPDLFHFRRKGLSIPLAKTDIELYWQGLTDTANPSPLSALCIHTVSFLIDWFPALCNFFEAKEDNFWYPRLYDLRQMRSEAPTCGQTPEEKAAAFQRRYGESLKAILCRLSLELFGRCLFCTRKGFFGVGLMGVEKWDVVFAIQGTKQLHAFRKMAGQVYKHMGAAILAPADKDEDACRGDQSLSTLFADIGGSQVSEEELMII